MLRPTLILLVFMGRLAYADIDFKSRKDLVDASEWPGVRLDVRYATTNNFTRENVYGDYRSCYLHRIAARKLALARDLLAKKKPGYTLLIFDCLRPRAIQKKFWARVKGTSQQKYVADPAKGSIHNYGFAIDLSLADDKGAELDMGTPYDYFGELAEPSREKIFLAEGRLTPEQIENRKLLRDVMTKAGFAQLPYEWWHYDALDGKFVREGFLIVE